MDKHIILRLVIIWIVFLAVLIPFNIWIESKQSKALTVKNDELAREIVEQYDGILTYSKSESEITGEDVYYYKYYLIKDAEGLPQEISKLCQEYLADVNSDRKISVAVNGLNRHAFGPIFVLSNYMEEEIYDHIVTLDIYYDSPGYDYGHTYQSLSAYEGMPEIQYLILQDDVYYTAIVTEQVDIAGKFESLKRLEVLRGDDKIYMTESEFCMADDYYDDTEVSDPSKITLYGTKASVTVNAPIQKSESFLTLYEDDYELEYWNSAQKENGYKYYYKIHIKQTSIDEIQNQIGYYRKITFE